MEEPKEFLVDMLGRVAGVNGIATASLVIHAPDSLDMLGLWNTPEREGFSRCTVNYERVRQQASAS